MYLARNLFSLCASQREISTKNESDKNEILLTFYISDLLIIFINTGLNFDNATASADSGRVHGIVIVIIPFNEQYLIAYNVNQSVISLSCNF